jgi:hypothetical protein
MLVVCESNTNNLRQLNLPLSQDVNMQSPKYDIEMLTSPLSQTFFILALQSELSSASSVIVTFKTRATVTVEPSQDDM